MHKNARLTPRGRDRIVRRVESGQTLEAVAEKPQTSARGRLASGLIDIVAKDWRDCRIAHPGRIGCAGRRRRRLSRRSNSCVASAGRASRSRLRPASRQPPSAVFFVGWG